MRNKSKIYILAITLISSISAVKGYDLFEKRYQIYKPYIVAAGEKYKIPILLIAAIIEVESKWDSNAISESNAVGLMGVLSDGSKKDIAKLKNPRTNIFCGTGILRHKIGKTGHDTTTDITRGLRAYNPNDKTYPERVLRIWLYYEKRYQGKK